MNTKKSNALPESNEPLRRYVLVWCLAIGGYGGLILFALAQGLGLIHAEANVDSGDLWVHISLAALLIGLVIGLVVVLLERLQARKQDPYLEIKE